MSTSNPPPALNPSLPRLPVLLVLLTLASARTPGAEPSSPDGLAKFDRFLELAEAAGTYVRPTGLDHWGGDCPNGRGGFCI
jgi:hypothetical protein